MEYELFLQSVRKNLEIQLGSDYTITLRSIPKNNGIVWDGVSICRKNEEVSPTIYLNEFYKELKNGMSVSEICDSIYRLYISNPGLPYLDSRVLASYQEVKDHIVYKLINTQANAAFLKRLPHMEFQDMSLVCYLLMEQPSETQGKDWLSTPSTYTAVEIQLDWAEQRVLETTLFPLGLLKFQFHYLRPAGDHFLLLGARCAYRENGPDQNAWIVSRDGAVLSRFCLGDGIQDCVVKKDGTIITSYFDEGVFGNYGWDEPLGACGLIAWTSEGTPLWKNENYSIYDCYAISLDEEENLWFYYYDEFRLVRTNFKEDFVFELPIEGSGAFSVAPSGNTFLFQGGYQQRDKFYFLTAHGDHLGKKQEAIPTCDGNKVAVEQCSLLRSRMLFLGKDGVLYGGIWGSDGQ